MTDFNKAIELKKDYSDAYVNRGVARGLSGDLNGAVEDLKRGAALNPKSISDESRGYFISPFENLNLFIRAFPANARAYELRGVLRLLQDKAKDAEADFRNSIAFNPLLKPEIDKIIKELR